VLSGPDLYHYPLILVSLTIVMFHSKLSVALAHAILALVIDGRKDWYKGFGGSG
jgi:hypothetical protein